MGVGAGSWGQWPDLPLEQTGCVRIAKHTEEQLTSPGA